MWEVDHNYDGRSPMSPGLIPQSSPAKTLAPQENYGDGSHVQTVSEMASHAHGPDPDKADGFLGHTLPGKPATYNVLAGGDTISQPLTGYAGGIGTPSVVTPTTTTHPVRGMYAIRRTSRKNIIIP